MKAHAARALGGAASLFAFGLLATPDAPAQAASTATAAPAPAYEDRLIGGNLAPDISLGDAYSYDSTGLARAIRVDAVTSMLEGQGANPYPTVHENGIVADAQWETATYGFWSANGAVRIGGGDERFLGASDNNLSFALHQRGMPFDGGWQADNALGDLNLPLVGLERAQPRFILSSGTMLGATTEWRGPDGLQFVAGGGEPGVLNGIKVPVFDTLGGSTAALGAQWSPAPQWTVGGEYAGARDANLYYQPYAPPTGGPGLPPEIASPRISSNTGILSAAWQQDHTHAQFNFIDGTLDGNSNAFGAFADASMTRGPYTQSFGAFYIEPNLAWGNQLIMSNAEGAYYRLDYQTRRWSANFGIDEVLPVSGLGVSSTFLNGNARYQIDRDTGIGAISNLLLSHDGSSETAWSLEGYVDQANSWGTGRVQLGYATSTQAEDLSATVQQSWTMPTGIRLATSVAVDSGHTAPLAGLPAQDTTVVRLAAYGGGNLTSRFSIDGNVQWAAAVQGRAAPSTSADVSLVCQLARSWELLFTYYENHIGSWTPLTVTSPLTPPVPVPQASQGQQGLFLTLRWQQSRGGHFVPLGGAPGSGSGGLTGVVYLDANENGRYDAGEAGAPNVTVILDGRFSVRTDANGRFDFPAVVAGRHVLTVQSDNLPLPWTLTNQGRTEVEVTTRDRIDVNIGAMRLR
jgi:SdrD B-like domain